jgi:exopolysaccharide biosynthesis polyprenyl glycosylphosphotransferase
MRYYLLNHYFGRALLAVVGDLLCFLAAAALTWWMLSPPFSLPAYCAGAALGGLAAFVALYYAGAYRLTVLGSGRSTLEAVVAAMGVAFVFALLVYFTVRTPARGVETLAHTAAIYFPLLLVSRVGFRFLCALPVFSQRVLLIGTSDLGVAIARALNERPNLGTELVGFLSDEFGYQRTILEGAPVLGPVHELEKVLDARRIDRIVVASKSRQEHFPAEVLLAQKLRGCFVESGVSFFERVTGRIYLRDLRASYLIFGGGFRQGPLSRGIKRLIDVSLASAGLVLSAPILLAAAVAIRLNSEGTVFFGQERVGEGGRPFRLWKLRSMVNRAEQETGPVWAGKDDQRVTRVGRVLRKTRIDELPQLWNVLIGEMSLVGPRPERPEFVDVLCEQFPYFRVRCALKPGITGWAQIRYGYVNDVEGVEEKLALDLYYMKYRSVTMDLLILWKTAKTVVLLHGL